MKQRRLSVIFLLVMILLTNVGFVAAFTPTVPDWWFTESYKIIELERPVGVGLRTINSANQNVRAYILIENNTGTSMHILAHTTPPDRVINKPAFEIPIGFVSIDNIRAGDAVSYDAEFIQYLAPEFADQNKRAPDRPANIEIPKPQESQIYVLFGDEILTFPIEVTYQLNADYNPENGKKPSEFVMGLFTLVVIIVGFIEWLIVNPIIPISLILIFIGLGFIRRRRNQSITG